MAADTGWQIASIVWISIFDIGITAVVISLLCKLFGKTTGAKISKFAKYAAAFCSIFCLLNCQLDLLHICVAYINKEPCSETSKYGIYMAISDATYFIASFSLHIMVIGRLFFSFQTTKYELSRKYLMFLSILLLSSLGSMTGYVYIIRSDNVDSFLSNSVKFITAIVINDFAIDISVLLLFIYKLHQLLVASVDINLNAYDTSKMQTINTLSYDFGANQKRLINLITRQSLLGTIIVLFNCTFYFKVLIDRYTVSDSYKPDIAYEMSYCLRSVENLIVTFLIYLNFTFNTVLYFKLCGCCHNGCYRCCIKCTRRNISKKTMNVYHRLDDHDTGAL